MPKGKPSPRVPLPLPVLRRVAAELAFPDNPTPDDLKALGAEIRRRYGVPSRIEDLLALSRQHDPFYVIEDGWRGRLAYWFVDTVWPFAVDRFGSAGFHLRRCHYLLGTTGQTGPPDEYGHAEPYSLATDPGVLPQAASAARELGLLPDDVRLIDRRNRDALNHLYEMREPPVPEAWIGAPLLWPLPTITVPTIGVSRCGTPHSTATTGPTPTRQPPSISSSRSRPWMTSSNRSAPTKASRSIRSPASRRTPWLRRWSTRSRPKGVRHASATSPTLTRPAAGCPATSPACSSTPPSPAS